MQEVEAAVRKENNKLKNEFVEMEKAIAERLGYLQRHKVKTWKKRVRARAVCSYKARGDGQNTKKIDEKNWA